MRKSTRLIVVSALLIVAHVLVPVAAAHPLGNFTINHYAGLHVSRDAVAIDYVLDMAEIPAFQEIAAFDANGDGQLDAVESARYHPAKCDAIRSDLALHVDGAPAALSTTASEVDFPPGVGGLPTLRLTCGFRAPMASSAGDPTKIEFADNSYSDRLGWREIVVTGDGMVLQGEFASTSLSTRLTTYPDNLLSSPLDERRISFDAVAKGASLQDADALPRPQSVTAAQPSSSREDAFTQLITLPDLNMPTLLFALAVSFVWGAMHALSPGHGKAMVAAYLVGARGTTRHAIVLGLTVTLTHTIGVFALGLITLFASNYILPEQLYPYLSLASGLLVLGIGLTLLISRVRAARSGRGLIQTAASRHTHDHHGHNHSHRHDHDHAHDHAHDLTHDRRHAHDHPHTADDHTHNPTDENGRITMRSLLALGISGGLIPCPTALVVLLSAIALGRVGFGLMLIVMFSAGLAAVLTGIGLLLVHGRRLFDRLPIENRWLHIIPLAGACLVVVTGAIMTVQAIASVGTLSV
jgi:ABC-type nickel/cobalt efflux system permease component RcnA